MGVRILTIFGLTHDDMEMWRNGDLFIDINTEDTYSRYLLTKIYNNAFEEHYKEALDDHDYMTFDDWCKEAEIFNAWDINFQFGGANWSWETFILKGEIVLIIALKD